MGLRRAAEEHEKGENMMQEGQGASSEAPPCIPWHLQVEAPNFWLIFGHDALQPFYCFQV